MGGVSVNLINDDILQFLFIDVTQYSFYSPRICSAYVDHV